MNNKYYISRKELVEIPVPVETTTYKPVRHEKLIDLTLDGIYHAGFTVEKEKYTSARNGNFATGRFFLGDVKDSELQLQIVWENSYDKSKALSFAVGANVLVCTNGMMAFQGISRFKKKHMGEIQTFTPEAIPEYIKSGAELFRSLQEDRDLMKKIPLNMRLVSELMGRMFVEERIIESTQLNVLRREIDKPTHDYKSQGSLWEFYQHTTFALGGVHPSKWVQDHLAMHRFFVEYAVKTYAGII